MKGILLFVRFGMALVAAAKTFYNATPEIPLSMMDSSVDDMYSGCIKEMSKRVQREYFDKEMNDSFFATVWKNAEKCKEKAVKIRPMQDAALTDDHLRAICLYTAGGKENFYKKFNDVVLKNAGAYKTTFPFHAVHFWLTRAIQILGENNETCHYVYRRTGTKFTGKINQIMRFGSFASSSFRSDMSHFGKETCFYIKTCSAAFLKDYPTLGKEELEVLIPPYEMFKIINQTKTPYEGLDCRNIFVLESAGITSNLNCKVAFN